MRLPKQWIVCFKAIGTIRAAGNIKTNAEVLLFSYVKTDDQFQGSFCPRLRYFSRKAELRNHSVLSLSIALTPFKFFSKFKRKVIVIQSCLTLCDPKDYSPPGSPVHGILQARTLEWVAISFSTVWKWKVKVKSLSRVQLLSTPRTAAYQAPPSMGLSRQEYWSGVPLPSLENSITLSSLSDFWMLLIMPIMSILFYFQRWPT